MLTWHLRVQKEAGVVEDEQLESLVQVAKGTVLFVPAGTSLRLHSLASPACGGCKLLAYAATANDNMFVTPLQAAKRMYRSMSDLSAAASAAAKLRLVGSSEDMAEAPRLSHVHSALARFASTAGRRRS